MSNRNDYILFYSNKCMHSKEFLVLLQKDPSLDRKFMKVNVDTRGIRIPNYIKSVPSAIIPINGQPSLLVGVNIFKWYDESHRQTVQQQEILDFDPSGMQGLSDTFSFIDTPQTGNTTSNVLRKTFSFISDNFSIQTPDSDNDMFKGNSTSNNNSGGGFGSGSSGMDWMGGGGGGSDSRTSQKKTQLDNDYEARMNQRNMEIPRGPMRIGGGN